MPNKLTVMAFDFGMARIGVAIGDVFLQIPHPLTIISGKNKFEKFAQIRELVDKWQPQRFVVGMPSLDPMNIISREKLQLITNIKKFSNRLKENFKINVEFITEDYSSACASVKLKEQKIFAQKQKDKLDAIAATIILQRYFAEMNINAV